MVRRYYFQFSIKLPLTKISIVWLFGFSSISLIHGWYDHCPPFLSINLCCPQRGHRIKVSQFIIYKKGPLNSPFPCPQTPSSLLVSPSFFNWEKHREASSLAVIEEKSEWELLHSPSLFTPLRVLLGLHGGLGGGCRHHCHQRAGGAASREASTDQGRGSSGESVRSRGWSLAASSQRG